MLRSVVAGFHDLLTPTHNTTIAAGYELAQLLVRHDNMEEANSILEWIGSSCVEKYGLRNERTIVHYIKVVDLLRSWSRDEDAKVLIHKIANLWTTNDSSTIPRIPGRYPGSK